MGYSLDRSIKVKNKYLSVIQDIYSSAKVFKSSHDDILKRRYERVLEQPEYLNLPSWAKEYLRGYERALMDGIYRYELDWYLWVNPDSEGKYLSEGKLCNKEEIKALQTAGYLDIYQNMNMDKSTHCWAGRPDKRF